MLGNETISKVNSSSFSSSYSSDNLSDNMEGIIVSSEIYIHPAAAQIGLMGLPGELIIYIMQKVNNDPTALINLSITCQYARENYFGCYKDVDRQYHILLHNLSYLALDSDVLNITLPLPHTVEWQSFKDHSVNSATEEPWYTVFIKKAYITCWDLLIKSQILEDQKTLTIISRLCELAKHICNKEAYAAELFSHRFPTEHFNQLAKINLDSSIQLAAQHFSLDEVKNFITTGLQIDQTNSDTAGIKAFLFYVCNDFTSHYEEYYEEDYGYVDEEKDEYEYSLIFDILSAGKFNINALDSDGHTALYYAIRAQDDKSIIALMRHSQFNFQKNHSTRKLIPIIKHTLESGYKFDSPIFQAVLDCCKNDDPYHLTENFYMMWRTEEKMIADLHRIENLNQSPYFVTEALKFAITKHYRAAERLLSEDAG